MTYIRGKNKKIFFDEPRPLISGKRVRQTWRSPSLTEADEYQGRTVDVKESSNIRLCRNLV